MCVGHYHYQAIIFLEALEAKQSKEHVWSSRYFLAHLKQLV